MDTKENKLNLTPEGIQAIAALQHSKGTLPFYVATLVRLSTFILHQGDEIGMSDGEAMHMLRALDLLRCDIIAIAGRTGEMYAETTDELEERLERQAAADDTEAEGEGSDE